MAKGAGESAGELREANVGVDSTACGRKRRAMSGVVGWAKAGVPSPAEWLTNEDDGLGDSTSPESRSMGDWGEPFTGLELGGEGRDDVGRLI